MSVSNKYFIKDGYIENEQVMTISSADNSTEYWSQENIGASKYYQYYVYVLARKLMLRHSLTSVIDLGCGPGVKLHELLSPLAKEVVGVDQESAVTYCKAHYPESKFYSVDLEHIDQAGPRDHFDLIVCSDVIEHLKDPDGLLQYIRNIAHSGSFVVISTPERDVIRGKDSTNSPNRYHIREWNSAELSLYLESKGLHVIQSALLPPLKPTLKLKFMQEII